jgi:predicted PurR-regulated permease PerM
MSLEENEDLINKFNQMNYVTLICNSIAGVIQGVLAGIVFWIAGVPAVILWALVMTLLAFMPIIGISIITIPTSVYFIITGQVLTGVSIFVSCSLISLLTENFFKPRFIGSRVQLNPIYVLLCIIGGMSTFGMGGIFYGPIIGIIFLTFASIYKKRYA